MGRILSTQATKRIVDGLRETFLEQASSSYKILFNKAPIFTTYYKLNSEKSTTDTTLGGVIEIIGKESPLKFDKIRDFPIYGITDMQLSRVVNDDLGIETEGLEGEAYILSDTIEPSHNDFFFITYQNTPLLLRVNNAEYEKIEGSTFYKITFHADRIDYRNEIEKQVVGKYFFELANVGTTYACVLSEENAKYAECIDSYTAALVTLYRKLFFDKNSSCVILKDEESSIFHFAFLEKFISENKLLETDTYMDSCAVNMYDPNKNELTLMRNYPTSLYGVVESGSSPSALNLSTLRTNIYSNNYASPLFYLVGAHRPIIEIIQQDSANPLHLVFKRFEILDSDFKQNTIAKQYVSSVLLVNIVSKILNNYYREDEKQIKTTEFLSAIEPGSTLYQTSSVFDMFFLFPIVILEMKRIKTALLAKK